MSDSSPGSAPPSKPWCAWRAITSASRGDVMKTAVLARIERTNLVLGVAATAVAGLLWGGRGMLAAAAGAALACANFWALRRLGARGGARAGGGAGAGAGPGGGARRQDDRAVHPGLAGRARGAAAGAAVRAG